MKTSGESLPRIIGTGAGGHCRVLIDIIRQTAAWQLHGLLDPDHSLVGNELDGVPVLGDDSLAEGLYLGGIVHAFLGVGSVGDVRLRRKLHACMSVIGFDFPCLVHPRALVASHVAIAGASCVMAGAILNPGTTIGTGVIVNSGAIIEHDCTIGDFAHLAPGVVLGGAVIVGEGSHVGMGSVIRQGIRIGRDVLVGAGSVVVKDIQDGVTVVGAPAREVSASS